MTGPDEAMAARLARIRAWRERDPRRVLFNVADYEREVREGGCFLCRLAAGDSAVPPHPMLYEDREAIAFLDRFPTQPGHSLVAPRRHVEHACLDASEEEYLRLQRVVHRVGSALLRETGAQRLYICSLGAREMNAHLHFHLVPIPPGTPLEAQENVALMKGVVGILDEPAVEREAFAARVRARIAVGDGR